MRPLRVLLFPAVLAAAVLLLLLSNRGPDRAGSSLPGETAAAAGGSGGRETDRAAGGRLEAASVPEQPPPPRPAADTSRTAVDDEDPWAVLVQGPGGEPVEATVTAVPLTPALQSFVEERVGIDAALLDEVEPFHERQTRDGRASLREELEAGECFVWASAPGLATRGVFMTLPDPDASSRTLQLPASPPLAVHVQDVDGQPLSGIEVYFSNPTWDANYTARSWRGRLERRFFLTTVVTGADGVARLDWPLEGPMTVVAGLEPGFAKAFLYEARAGERNDLVLYRPAGVSGRVTDARGRPLAEAEVTFLGHDGQQTVGIGDAVTEEDGRYSMEISTRFPVAVGTALYPDKAFVLHRVLDPTPGGHYEVDFVLPDAAPVSFQVVDGAGRPAAGVKALLKRSTLDWIPGVPAADDAGRFRVEHFLAPGGSYLAQVLHGGLLVGSATFTVPAEAPYTVVLELPEAARLGRVRMHGAEVTRLAWFSRDQFGRSTEWPGDAESSPVLPPGLGRLEVVLADGSTVARPLALRPGDNGDLEWEAARAELRFELPRGGGEEGEKPLEASLLAAEGGRAVVRGLAKPGANRLGCPPGVYRLHLQSESGAAQDFGPVEVPRGGVDLGLIRAAAGGGLAVEVEDTSGAAVAGISVRAYGAFLEAPRIQPTDEEGRCVLQDLAAGVYTVRVYPFDSMLMPYPKLERRVRVSPGETATLRFRVAPGRLLRGRVAGELGAELTGFHLAAGGALEIAHVGGDGSFTVGMPGDGDWAGAVASAPGRATVLAEVFHRPAEEHVFAAGGLLRRRLRVAAAAGAAVPGAQLEWLLDGVPLPGRAFPDAEGGLVLAVPPGAPLVARLRFADGSVRELDPASLAEDLVLRPAGPGPMLEVVHLDGEPVAGARVLLPELDHDLVTGASGRLRLPGGNAGSRGLRVEASGHWPVVATASSRRVFLRRGLERVEVLLPAGLGARSARLTPRFELGVPLAAREARVEDGAVVFTRLPEGDWRLEASDAAGRLVAAEVLRLRFGPAALTVAVR